MPVVFIIEETSSMSPGTKTYRPSGKQTIVRGGHLFLEVCAEDVRIEMVIFKEAPQRGLRPQPTRSAFRRRNFTRDVTPKS